MTSCICFLPGEQASPSLARPLPVRSIPRSYVTAAFQRCVCACLGELCCVAPAALQVTQQGSNHGRKAILFFYSLSQ